MHMHHFHKRHAHKKEHMVELAAAKAGTICRVMQINGGREVNARLASLGIFPGIQISVSNNTARGPMVIHVLDSRVMLSRGLAEKILVE